MRNTLLEVKHWWVVVFVILFCIGIFGPSIPGVATGAVLGALFVLYPGPGYTLIRERRARRLILRADISLAERFLKQTGCETEIRGDFLLVPRVKGRLQEFAPLHVMVVRDAPTEVTVAALARKGGSAGILIYGQPPDELARLAIATARMREKVSIIAIPLAEVERALLESSAAGVLAQLRGPVSAGC